MKKLFIFSFIIISLGGCGTDPIPPLAPTVTTGDATNIGYYGATLSVSISNQTETKEIGVLYGTSSNVTLSNAKREIISYSHNITVYGLSAGTTYYYKAYATNGNDYVYGETKSFWTTIKTTTLATVKTYSPAGTIVTKTTFNVSAELTYSNLVSEWGIVISLSDPSDPTSGRYDKFATVIDGKQTMYYSNCTANTKYYYSSYAKLITGDYIYGDIWSITTAVY